MLSQTSLHYASTSGDKEIIELLIGKDADLNAKDKFGKTPLDFSVRLDQNQTTDLLLKHDGKTGAELKAVGK